MSIATRVTLLSVLLVVLTLSLFGFFSQRQRRVEMTADLERQTRLFGSALTVALEAANQDGLFEDVRSLIERMQAAEQSIDVVYLDLLHHVDNAAFGRGIPAPKVASDGEKAYKAPPLDPTREERVRRIQITGQAYGEHIQVGGREVFAYIFPVHGSQHQIVAAVELIRGTSELEGAMAQSTRDVALTLGLLFVLLALLVGLTVRQEVSGPLLRLVGGIDEVTRGDYTGAILRERSDEIGLLADRFNEMTRSLRQAREQILAGVDAKLQLETRLRHSDKLATIGQLAAGIAHEVGTPLNVIGGRARVMARRSDDPAAVQKNAEIIATQAERITKIIQQLLDYARRKAPARAELDLQRVCVSTLDFLEHQLSTRQVTAMLHPFAVPTRGDEDPAVVALLPKRPLVLGDADQLQQVCLNLCVNAIQAMPEGGTLDLHLDGLVRRKPGLDKAPPGAYVMLSVADTGVGIDDADLGRIFEPFYSTKTLDKKSKLGDGPSGSGLGLSVSAGIVKDHDGWIEIERRPSGGTIFRVFLPAPEDDAVIPPRRSSAPPRVEPNVAAAIDTADAASSVLEPGSEGDGASESTRLPSSRL